MKLRVILRRMNNLVAFHHPNLPPQIWTTRIWSSNLFDFQYYYCRDKNTNYIHNCTPEERKIRIQEKKC